MYTHTFSTAVGNHALPNELVEDIVNRLDGHTQALASLGSTSRAFRNMTRDMLYRKIAVGENPKSNDTMNLIRTLMEHPEYGAKINELSIVAPLYPPNSASLSDAPSRPGRYRFELDDWATDWTQHHNFMQSIVDRIKTAGDRGRYMSLTHHWITSILDQERAAYTPLLLGLCPNAEILDVGFDFDGGHRYTLPWLFGFSYVLDNDYGWDVYNGEIDFHRFGVDMPKVTLLRTMTHNMEIVELGFANLTTLDMEGCVFRDGHYGSSSTVNGEVGKLPKLQKVIFRVDWQELTQDRRGPGVTQTPVAISSFFRSVELPRLTSVTVVLERSPRRSQYLYARCSGNFDVLVEQINTRHDPHFGTHHPAILQQIHELNILVNDEIAAFSKDFLRRLKPITNLLHAINLRRLTLPWQALATAGYDRRKTSLSDTRTLLPASLETLRITYPQALTSRWLQDLFVYAPEHKGNLQLVELLCCETWAMPEHMLRSSQQDILDTLPVNVSLGAVEGIDPHPFSPTAT